MMQLIQSTLVDEMIGQFKDPRLITYKLKYSIIDEMGADEDGVSRDVYSGFWSEFLDCAAERGGYQSAITLSKMAGGRLEVNWKNLGQRIQRPRIFSNSSGYSFHSGTHFWRAFSHRLNDD